MLFGTTLFAATQAGECLPFQDRHEHFHSTLHRLEYLLLLAGVSKKGLRVLGARVVNQNISLQIAVKKGKLCAYLLHLGLIYA